MTYKTVIIICLLLGLAGVSLAERTEYYFKFEISNVEELGKLTKVISIDNLSDKTVFAYANPDELKRFEEFGYSYEMLPHPGTLIQPRMSSDKAEINAWDVYPTYDSYISMMYQFQADFPNLCVIENIGSTVEGRDLLFARISDNVTVEEDEPEVMYTSSMHGDEITGYVLMLRLIDSLLTGYGSDSLITRLVDSCEIWINPSANPDGTYNGGNNSVYGATRYNANGYDLNRNFPDPDDGPNPNGPWQPETIAMMDFADNHTIVISANHHGGIEVINYPWDTWSRLHVDDNWMYDISRNFADSSQYFSPSGYMTALNNGITNGYAWYPIAGGRQDYMTYWGGSREITMELSDTKLIAASQLPNHWNYNRVSFLNYLEEGLYGIRGVVTDSYTGFPVFATITITGHDLDMDSSRVFTDPDVGDYHRMIEPGIYDVVFNAPGYYTKTAKTVIVSANQSTRADVMLIPLPNEPILNYDEIFANLIDPGDTASFDITIRNDGIGNATGVSAILSSTDPNVTVSQNSSTFPDINAGGATGQSDSEYEIIVSSSCPRNYEISFTLAVTADDGYSNNVTFELTVGQIVERFESGDFTYLPWQMGGFSAWSATSISPYEGTYSAKSGPIADNQYSQMELNLDVNSAGTISFYYKVSSENNYDYFRFFIDGTENIAISGEAGWSFAEYPVTSGPHSFLWKYTKDGSQIDGSDCAWVDKIILPPVIFTPEISTTSLPDWTAGQSYSQQLVATGGLGQLTWTDRDNDLVATGLTLSGNGQLAGTPGTPGPVSFTGIVHDESGGSAEQLYSFDINSPVSISTTSLPNHSTDSAFSFQLLASGGTGLLTWSDLNNDLAASSLSLTSSGLLSGTVLIPETISFIAQASDITGAIDNQPLDVTFYRTYVCGDANGDAIVNVGDAVFIINFVFKDGDAPDPLLSGDANCDNGTNVGDGVYIINFVFKSGPSPCCP